MAATLFFEKKALEKPNGAQQFLQTLVNIMSNAPQYGNNAKRPAIMQRFKNRDEGGSSVDILVWGTLLTQPGGERVTLSAGGNVTLITKDLILYRHPTFQASNGLSALIYEGTRPLFPHRKRRPRPVKGKHVPRPMNCFMLYRKERCKMLPDNIPNGDKSRIISEEWAILPEEVRERYKKMAKQQALEHQAAHPHYNYFPKTKNSATKPQQKNYNENLDTKSRCWASNPTHENLDNLLDCLDGVLYSFS